MAEPNFDDIIHAERGALLRQLPKGSSVLCSAGCSGRWYFDWIEREYGPVTLHYGVELFSPKPADLPPNVRWIQNSVSNMIEVPSGAVDLLFSGQNLEHLYLEDLHGFLAEANRIVRPGGLVVIDSPNRPVSQEIGYTHPQHTLEFSVTDVTSMMEAAGFEVSDVRGIWSCANGYRRYANVSDLVDVEQRIRAGRENINDAFIWWIVARKIAPVRADLPGIVDSILCRSFQPFVASRFQNSGRRVHAIEGTDTILAVDAAMSGFVFYGPYIPMRPGRYEANFDCKFLSVGGALELDVVSAFGNAIHARCEVPAAQIGRWRRASVEFTLGEYTEGIETRMVSDGANALVRLGSQIRRV